MQFTSTGIASPSSEKLLGVSGASPSSEKLPGVSGVFSSISNLFCIYLGLNLIKNSDILFIGEILDVNLRNIQILLGVIFHQESFAALNGM